MRRSDFGLLFLTALCWGSSFMFIKIALESVTPGAIMVVRCALGGVALWVTAWWLRRRRGQPRLRSGIVDAVRTRPWSLAAFGVLTGVPLWLVGVAEEHVDSGIAGIANATVPLWAAVLGVWFDAAHRTGPRRIAGVSVGFIGIVLLTASQGAVGGSDELLGVLIVAFASSMYAAGSMLVRERLVAIPSAEVAAWSVSIPAAVFVLPVALSGGLDGILHARTQALGALLVLAVVGTWIGFLAYYELVFRVGAARATMVTYLTPPFAVGYGWLFLHERVGPTAFVAMLVILAGVWIGSRPERTSHGSASGVVSPAVDAGSRR